MKNRLAIVAAAAATLCCTIPAGAEEAVGVHVGPLGVGVNVDTPRVVERRDENKTVIIDRDRRDRDRDNKTVIINKDREHDSDRNKTVIIDKR